MIDDLVKRLRKVEPDAPGERTRWYRNPDGPEAADRIEQLEAALRLGVDMREKQKAYFKRRFQDVLLDCKKAERDFDVAARAALGEKQAAEVGLSPSFAQTVCKELKTKTDLSEEEKTAIIDCIRRSV